MDEWTLADEVTLRALEGALQGSKLCELYLNAWASHDGAAVERGRFFDNEEV